MKPGLFRREFLEQHAQSLPLVKEGVVKGTVDGFACFGKCVWDGETYTNLIIGKGPSLIGLQFLARHLVTFNFPKGTMYLKRTSGSPLSPESSP